jgi:hypothetical protein
MFIHGKSNTKEVQTFLSTEKEKSIAVAFVGVGLSSKLKGSARILCNVTSGATNPKEIARLLERDGIEVRNNSLLHAKVYIDENHLIVGSANLSTNGISLERECEGWTEASICSTDTQLIAEAEEWFEILWDEAEKITDTMLKEAQAAFDERRKRRPWPSKSNVRLRDLLDRDIYCIIYKIPTISNEAASIMADNFGKTWEDNGYGCYEQWGAPIPHGLLLDFYFDGKNLNYTGTWKNDGYNLKSKKTDIQIVKKVEKRVTKDVTTIPSTIAKSISKALINNLETLWPDYKSGHCGGNVIHINTVLASLDEGDLD